MIINGKEYPMWSQFVERQNEWIGGMLRDIGDSMDRRMGAEVAETEITGIRLLPNGKESAMFMVDGKDFGCGFDVRSGGISGSKEFGEGWLMFSGYGGHTWGIRQKEVNNNGKL